MELSEIREISDQLYRIVMSGLAAVNRYDERYTGPVSMRRVSESLVDPDMPLHEQERASVLAMTRVLSGLATLVEGWLSDLLVMEAAWLVLIWLWQRAGRNCSIGKRDGWILRMALCGPYGCTQ